MSDFVTFEDGELAFFARMRLGPMQGYECVRLGVQLGVDEAQLFRKLNLIREDRAALNPLQYRYFSGWFDDRDASLKELAKRRDLPNVC